MYRYVSIRNGLRVPGPRSIIGHYYWPHLINKIHKPAVDSLIYAVQTKVLGCLTEYRYRRKQSWSETFTSFLWKPSYEDATEGTVEYLLYMHGMNLKVITK